MTDLATILDVITALAAFVAAIVGLSRLALGLKKAPIVACCG